MDTTTNKTLKLLLVSLVLITTNAYSAAAIPSWDGVKTYMTTTTPKGCSTQGKDAKIIMNLRQNVATREEALALPLTPKQRIMTLDAYDNYPIQSVKSKQMMISGFGKKYRDLCKEGK